MKHFSLRRLLHPIRKALHGDREGRRRGGPPRRKRPAGRLAVEQLEDRCVPSTLQAISVSQLVQPPSATAAGASDSPSVSGDGRYVVFESKAPNLVPGQKGVPNVDNVFLLDHSSGKATLISHMPGSPLETPLSGFPSYSPLISGDGNYIVYGSQAPELATGQSTFSSDFTQFGRVVLLYNVQTGQTTLLSHATDSATTPAVGLDGMTSAHSDPDAISFDGRYVLFNSDGTDLVPGQVTAPSDPNSSPTWLYEYDTTAGTPQLVSHAVDKMGNNEDNVTDDRGVEVATFSDRGTVVYAKVGAASVADNGMVAYVDRSDNLVQGFTGIAGDAYLYDPTTQTNRLVSFVGSPTNGAGAVSFGAVISRDASTVAYVMDVGELENNPESGTEQVFRYDGKTDTLVSAAAGSPTAGGNGNSGAIGLSLAVSRNGQFIAFTSQATNLITGQTGAAGNVFLYNSQSSGLTLLSGVNGSRTEGAGGVPDLSPPLTPPRGDLLPGTPADPITGNVLLGGPQVLSMSDDGSLVAYVSSAGDLVPGQSGPASVDNVFLYTAASRTNALVSGVDGSATVTADQESSFPVLSGEGNLLAFHSREDHLLAGRFDGNGVADVFTAVPGSPGVTLVSAAAFQPSAPGASFATSVSADGRYIVFTSTATNLLQNQVTVNSQQNVFLFDKQSGTISLVNHVPKAFKTTGDGGVHPMFAPSQNPDAPPPDYVRPVISADGNWIAFASFDDDLVTNEVIPKDEQDQPSQPGPIMEFIYLYEVATGNITLVNHMPGETPADRATVAAPEVPPMNGVFYDSFQPAISADGEFVAFAFGEPDDDGVGVALYSRATDQTTTIVADQDTFAIVPRDPTISDNGQFVSYLDQGQVYVYDGTLRKSVLASHDDSSPTSTTPANGASSAPVISHDGSAVAFVSAATNLVPGQAKEGFTNVFLYQNDISGNDAVGPVRLVSRVGGSAAAAGGDGNSDSPAIDKDGSYVAFRSDATDLVPGQSGATGNIFEFNTQTNTQTLVSHDNSSLTSTVGVGGSSQPVIDDDGHLVSYVSTAGNLVPNQTGSPAVDNVFVWLRQTGANILASGQNGSATITGNGNSDLPLLTRHSATGFSSVAKNLSDLGGAKVISVAYLNALVAVLPGGNGTSATLTVDGVAAAQIILSGNTVVVGSPAGSAVGDLSASTRLSGQFLLPKFGLPPGVANNDLFGLSGTEVVSLFQATASGAFTILLNVDIGIGDGVVTLQINAVASPSAPDPLLAELVSVRVGKGKKARLMVEVIDLVTGAEVEALVSPFQAPAYRGITLTPLGDGLFRLAARKGKHTVSVLLSA